MGTGTESFGKKGRNTQMIHCRRCGNKTYHVRHKICSKCGFGKSAKLRNYNWMKKKPVRSKIKVS